jgi:hypothetical protein
MRWELAFATACLVVLAACGKPVMPPDPPRLREADPSRPSLVQQVEVEHFGCPGSCPVYRVSVASTGTFQYEGTHFVQEIGRKSGRVYSEDRVKLFAWLDEHPEMYSVESRGVSCNDCEFLRFRFYLKDGRTLEIMSGVFPDRDEDNYWVLSSMVDGIVMRHLIKSEVDNGQQPAT